jgi:hypothetical protein
VPPYAVARVSDWVGDMVADGYKSAPTAVAALNKFHVSAGGAPLRDTPAIQQALAGWERLRPPPIPKLPFTKAMLAQVYEQLDTSTLLGARDYALLAVAHGGAFRGESELLAVKLPLRTVTGGSVVEVHTKTDRGVWETSARRIPHGSGGRDATISGFRVTRLATYFATCLAESRGPAATRCLFRVQRCPRSSRSGRAS